MEILRKIARNKKRVFRSVSFVLLLMLLPAMAYFLTNEHNFDRRTEAAIFNALVNEMDVKLEESPDYVPGVLRLEFPEGLSNEQIEQIIGGPRTTPVELLDTPYERVEYIEVDENNMAWEMAKYERYLPTESVDLSYRATSLWSQDANNRVLPNDWNAANHWYFNKIKLPEVWKLQGCLENSPSCGGSKDVVVAVIDTGLAFNSPEAQGMNIFSGRGYNKNAYSDRGSDSGHGTYVAGVIASSTNNSSSSVGLAHNVTIMPLSINNSEKAIYLAAEYGADVVNMSWGFANRRTACSGPVPPIQKALAYAYGQGVVLVASSGNSGQNCLSYPSSDSKVISVGAVNANSSRSKYSQYGSGLDFVAPVGSGESSGVAVWQQTFSCVPNCPPQGSSSFSDKFLVGTSFASPQVAGAAALILSLDPSLSPKQVKDVLIATVDDIGTKGKDSQFGYGLLNLQKIYEHFEVDEPPPVDPPPSGPCAASCDYSLTDKDARCYLDRYGDLQNAFGDDLSKAKKHWSEAGCKEGRNPCCQEELSIEVFESTDLGKGEFGLQWQVKGATQCKARASWGGPLNPERGSRIVHPTSTSIYRLVCTNNTEIVSKNLRIVKDSFNPKFSVENARLNWELGGADSCVLSLQNVKNNASSSEIVSGNITANGSLVVSPTMTTDYKLLCKKGSSELTLNRRVVVDGVDLEFHSFPEVLHSDSEDKSVLVWNSKNSNSCVASKGWEGSKELQGQISERPEETTGYHLICGKGENKVFRFAKINITKTQGDECTTSLDCERENPPYEVCHKGFCYLGDVDKNEEINMEDFNLFGEDYASFRGSGWKDSLRRSDFLKNRRITMASYSVFVQSYRVINEID